MIKFVIYGIFFLTLGVTLTNAALLEAVRAKCLELDENYSISAGMLGHSCFVIVEWWSFAASGVTSDLNQKCTLMPNIVDGHLPWLWKESDITALAAVFPHVFDLYNGNMSLGLIRLPNSGVSFGENWNFLDQNQYLGAVADLKTNTSDAHMGLSEPDNIDDDGSTISDTEPMVMILGSDKKLRSVNHLTSSTGLNICQYDALATNVRFRRHSTCRQLNITSIAVDKVDGTGSQQDCAQMCTNRIPICTAFSFDNTNGCRLGRLITNRNLETHCITTAQIGHVYIEEEQSKVIVPS